jgi:hypothetical protein
MLTDYLHCNTKTGILTWQKKPNRRIVLGSVAGSKTRDGYIRFILNGISYNAHHVVWFFYNGVMPTQLDHINGIKTDNRISNLREVTTAENAQNHSRCHVDNKSGLLGVSPNGKKWRATIRINGKQMSIGTFGTPEEAHKAYVITKRKLHPMGTL